MFDPFQKFIPRAANRYGLKNAMEAAQICHIFGALIPEIFGKKEEAQASISPAHYKRNTLTVNVKSPAWAQEVIMRKSKIIEEMNQKIGRKIIRDLKTQLDENVKHSYT